MKILIGLTGGVGSIILAFLFFCCLDRPNFCCFSRCTFCKNKGKNVQYVEEFLRSKRTLAPKRYSYSDIKKMINHFEDKLGQGGFGGVFKGKLQNGCPVAVKVLHEAKGNGEEFINELASIGRTNHLNIITLEGFCSEGKKRALVYEFMPNGSLEKFIYRDKQSAAHHFLGWEKLNEISLGIARGLEYLHRGCRTPILHLDIKPHNILLDEDFSPKIADFGLAKLCPAQDNVVSNLVARGTLGYTAPEVFYANEVSNKSDVYSYGMMLLEMVGGRRNMDPGVEDKSQEYFPKWIYNRLNLPRHLGLHAVTTEVEEETARKMILVGLWCIQTDPADRPSMTRVLEMLEGSLAGLPMPPAPFLCSPRSRDATSSTISMS